MVINTKSVKKIPISNEILIKAILIRDLEKKLSILDDALQLIIDANRWIEIKNKNYYYIPEDGVIIPNPLKIQMNPREYISLSGLKWDFMYEWFVKKWFVTCKSDNPLLDNFAIGYTATDNVYRNATYVYCGDTKRHMHINDGFTRDWGIEDTDGIKIPMYEISDDEKSNLLLFLIINELNVFEDEYMKRIFFLFSKLNYHNLIGNIGSENIFLISDSEKYNKVIEEFDKLGIPFNPDESDEKLEILEDSYYLDDNILELVKNDLLNCDKVRVNMDSYPEHILQDPQSGHWGLWDGGNSDLLVNISSSLVARNPVYDALDNKGGVVGIDFGTKSTVVTYRQSTADILPMRIGSGQFSRVVSRSDYENPTVMELRNIKKFLEAYQKYEGRPNTCWEDLLISHEAAEQLKSGQSKGDTFSTFFSEMKQWASDKNIQVHLRDLQGKEVNIPPYLSLGDDDFDPIEIYAYYLGLFINNMKHKIFLRYKLSFPATVEKTVRDKLLKSFTSGIKKSLPVQVLNDELCMRMFKVEQGLSEPAAYAITALNEYGFDPEEDEKFYYGIFDFGGGTTDFDFGVWSSEEDEPENYDYQISHFGQGGDPYLGGENLLNILAYQVLINNYNRLLEKKIVFIRPFGEKEIVGKDYLICNDSQYAHFNQKRLMEKLRGVWENNSETRNEFKSGTITVSLFTMEGASESNCPLDVNLEELDALLDERIDKGVAQFFEAFKNCFIDGNNIKYINNVNGFNIFLAGNSSKSPFVYKAFKKYIDSIEKPEWFKVYPPLGTELSDKILSGNIEPTIDSIIADINLTVFDKNVSENTDDNSKNTNFEISTIVLNQNEIDLSILSKPTGKTGVAFGLLNNRVRVIQNETEEIGFRYYIGQNRKQKFYCVINKENQNYNVWYKFCKASREEFEMWFTRSATAPSNKLSINQIGIHSELGVIYEPSSDKSVFIRLVSPTDIEYVIATDDEIMNSSFDDSNIERISLQEKQ